MNTARCMALMIWTFSVTSALAAPVPQGVPFHVRHGETVELTDGVKLKFVDVTSEGRCAADVSCLWQGEAFLEIELQVKGQTARAAITTEKTAGTLLAHRVKLLGLYPWPRNGEQRPAKEYVAFFRVADAAPAPAMAFENRAAALAAATRYVDAYARAANEVCAAWQQRRLSSYIEDSGGLCQQIARLSRTARAVSDGDGSWRFFFLVDDPKMRTQMNEDLYLVITMPSAPKDALDQVRESDIVVLPCDARLLDGGRGGCDALRER